MLIRRYYPYDRYPMIGYDGPRVFEYIYPVSKWPRTEEDWQLEELKQAWAEVDAIAPGVSNGNE